MQSVQYTNTEDSAHGVHWNAGLESERELKPERTREGEKEQARQWDGKDWVGRECSVYPVLRSTEEERVETEQERELNNGLGSSRIMGVMIRYDHRKPSRNCINPVMHGFL